jgi:hypothetical protein
MASFDLQVALACTPIVPCGTEMQARAIEVDALPEESPVADLLGDQAVMRGQAPAAC